MLPVDIVTQILNFGLSAPIDIQIIGPNLYGNRALAERMLDEVRYVPGAADARIQQPFDYPNMTVNVDRTRASAIGLTQQNVAQSLLVALSGSFQTSPNFYLDPRNGVSYNIATQTPAVPPRHHGRPREPSRHRMPPARIRRRHARHRRQPSAPPLPGLPALSRCWATWPPSCPAPNSAPSATTTSSRSSISTPTSMAPTSAQ